MVLANPTDMKFVSQLNKALARGKMQTCRLPLQLTARRATSTPMLMESISNYQLDVVVNLVNHCFHC